MSKPTDDLTWGTDASAAITEPSSGSKTVGWFRGFRPPASWLNWWMRGAYRWINWFDTVLGTDTNQTVTIASTSSATQSAVTVTSGSGNHDAVTASGHGNGNGVTGTAASGGTGNGLSGTGGSSGGAGVTGTGGGAGYGVEGTGGSTDGTGVGAFGGGTNGVGVFANGKGTGAAVQGTALGTGPGGSFGSNSGPALRLSTGSQPSTGNQVGDLYVTSGGVLKICTVAGSPGTWVSVGAQT